MEPVDFKESSRVLHLGDNDPNPVPARLKDGVFTTVWRLSDDDMMNIVKNRLIIYHVKDIGGFAPMRLGTIDPETQPELNKSGEKVQ